MISPYIFISIYLPLFFLSIFISIYVSLYLSIYIFRILILIQLVEVSPLVYEAAVYPNGGAVYRNNSYSLGWRRILRRSVRFPAQCFRSKLAESAIVQTHFQGLKRNFFYSKICFLKNFSS